MILAALRQLALDEGLLANPAYEVKAVHYEIVLGRGGKFVSLTPLGDPAEKGWAGSPQPVPRPLPGSRRSGSTIDPGFLVDNASFVLGLNAPADADKKSFPAAEMDRRRTAFQAIIDAAVAACPDDEALAAVSRFLRDLAAGDVAVPADPRLRSNHRIGFRFKPDIDVSVHERPSVQAYWQGRRGPTADGAAEPTFQCLVTGERGPAALSHPVVQRVPGGNTTGVRLVSFNAPAFTSYGLEQSHNAAVSQAAADAYTEALRRLLNPDYPDPRTPGKTLDARSFRLSADTAVVFWAAGDQTPVSVLGASLHDPGPDDEAKKEHAEAVALVADPKVIEGVHRGPWKGGEVSLSEADGRQFFTLTLSGVEARAVIRGWHETTLGNVLRNVRQYFQDIDIVGRPPNRPRPLLGLVASLGVRNKLENAPSGLAAELFAAVLGGRPFPLEVLSAAVRRTRVEKDERYQRFDEWQRFGLLRGYLVRARRAGLLPASFPEVHPVVDESCPAPAYRLGRLFAVLEKVQQDAISPNATIRDRYYGAASATPGVVFPQLLRKLPHHLKNCSRPAFYERLVQEIVGGLEATPFPATMPLEHQGLFALGYYHEAQAVFDKPTNEARKARYFPDAPKEG